MTITSRLSFILFIAAAFSLAGNCAFGQLQFVQNKGQWNKKADYRGDFSSGSFFLENRGFTVLLNKEADLNRISEYGHGENNTVRNDSLVLHSFAYNVTFLGSSGKADLLPEKQETSYNNYFLGNDAAKWASNCRLYGSVTYRNIYPNIDVHYYSNGNQLKYDFIVHPGGNPNAIALRFDGPLSLTVKNKNLVVGTTVGDVTELSPYTYQAGPAGTSDVSAKYKITDNVVTFDIDKYDPQATLVIDPQLIFSTFTGSRSDNWGYTATPGRDGTFYAGGIVFNEVNNGYPVSNGAFQTTFQGGTQEGEFGFYDMAITKFSATGNAIIYSTYLGGSGNEQPHSMIVDADGNLIIAGRSNSANYPVKGPLGASRRGANFDIVVTKLNATGTALLGSVIIGGSGNDGVNIRAKYNNPPNTPGLVSTRLNYGDDARSEVILDASNNIYLASCTQSADFPVVSPVQPVLAGGAFSQDGVIMKFTPDLSAILFSTFFGGSQDDACYVAAINPVTGNLYVGGVTASGTLPGPTGGVKYPTSQGGIDGFVTELTPNGLSIIKTSFFGTGSTDAVFGLKFDKKGFPYIMGTSLGSWPVVNANFRNAGSRQYIAKLKPDLSDFVYSTIFGSNSAYPNISPVAFLVDRCENVYVSGWGGGLNSGDQYSPGNTLGVPEVNSIAPYPSDGKDFYFFVLQKDALSQLFGSRFGEYGGLGDHVDGGTSRFDENGVIYQAICANCGGKSYNPPVPFPTTVGSVGPPRFNPSSDCNLAAVKIEMNFAGVGSDLQSSINGDTKDTVGCIPLTVNFKDLIHKGVTYYWNFNSAVNPGNTDLTTTASTTSFTFTQAGTYVIRLIAEDLNTCNQRDTSYVTIRAGDNPVLPKFAEQKLGACTSTTYQFTNQTLPAGGASFGPRSFVWDFGDGSPQDTTGFTPNPPPHTFPGPGAYFVKLYIIDAQFCNAPDFTVDTLRINSNVRAKPNVMSPGCAPYEAHFINNSDGGLTWLWDLGDGTTSTDFAPIHVYPNVGTYKYRLIAYDSTTCNKVDTSQYFILKVVQKPQARADWAPNPPEANVPVRFTNLSTYADSYLWNFGDGETSTEFAPVHEYNATGSYNANLVAYSVAGCTDTFNLTVNTLINPLLDVPNAFTPTQGGLNSEVHVRGFGIGKLDWRIYNRWGQLVFQSQSKKIGWNGYFKGKLLPMDVYTYTLDASFTDGKTERKTGDITLLR